MTEPPTLPEPGTDVEAGPGRVLSRDGSGRMLTGVCAGLGRHTGIDPVLFRVGFALLILASGIGLLLYVGAFLLMRRPDGGPGYLEQVTRRTFDAETALALLAGAFTVGLVINVMSRGISRGTIVVGTLLAIALLAAHARGVDLITMVRSMPDRATGSRESRTSPVPPPASGRPPGYVTGEPFAPHGPYGPYRWDAAASPSYPPITQVRPRHPRQPRQPRQPRRPRRPRSAVSTLIIGIVLLSGGIMVSVERSGTDSGSLPLFAGVVLAAIGAGLLASAWLGRGAAVIAAGVIVALVLLVAARPQDFPKVGSFAWQPVDIAQAAQNYSVGVGEGRLDLSKLAIAPGRGVTFTASVSVGELTVLVPADARVKVRGHVRLGEMRIAHHIESGVNMTVNRVVPPATTGPGDAPTIDLRVTAGIGDVVVQQAA